MVNLVPYLRGSGQMYDLDYDIAGRQGTQTLQTQHDRNRGVFYQVKDSQWERLYWDRHYIYRHADTSEGNNRYYIQTTRGKPGAVWCPANMQVGQSFERNPHVVHYFKNDCEASRIRGGRIRTQGAFRSTIKLLAHHDSHTYPSGITLQDVVVLAWIVDTRTIETYHYARNYGLVAWSSPGVGQSFISAHRSDPPGLQREIVPSLADFDPDTLYYCPTPCHTPKLTTPGIDVSKWQGPNIDWGEVAQSGIKYAFIRASYGRRPDPCFLRNVKHATDAGIHTGAYHYLHAAKPVQQAEFFYDQICSTPARSAGTRPLPLLNVLDVEGKGKTPEIIKAFLVKYEALTAEKPLIYTAAYIWNNLPGDTSWATDYDLWVANYTPGPRPYLPKPWRTWVFWQHTSTHQVPGIRGPVDHNRFNGSYDDLLAYLQQYWITVRLKADS